MKAFRLHDGLDDPVPAQCLRLIFDTQIEAARQGQGQFQVRLCWLFNLDLVLLCEISALKFGRQGFKLVNARSVPVPGSYGRSLPLQLAGPPPH
jgi:hypothetical protein